MNPPNTRIIPEFYTTDGGRGKHKRNGSDSMGTEKILQGEDFLVPCRLLTEAISLSMRPNDTHPYIELNHEPKFEHN